VVKFLASLVQSLFWLACGMGLIVLFIWFCVCLLFVLLYRNPNEPTETSGASEAPPQVDGAGKKESPAHVLEMVYPRHDVAGKGERLDAWRSTIDTKKTWH
jgi:hypothetical protein